MKCYSHIAFAHIQHVRGLLFYFRVWFFFSFFRNNFFLKQTEERGTKPADNHRSRSNVEKKTCHSMLDENRGKRIAIRPPNHMYKCWVLIYLTENNNLHNVVRLSVCAAWDVWMMAMMTIIICLHIQHTHTHPNNKSRNLTRCVGSNSDENWKWVCFCGNGANLSLPVANNVSLFMTHLLKSFKYGF